MSHTTNPIPDSGPEQRGPVDLKALVQGLAPHRDRGAPTTGAYRRTVRKLEHGPRSTAGVEPLPVVGFLDGIQRLPRMPLARFQSRDVICAFLAAGVTRGGQLLNVEERLAVLCSALDEDKIRAILPDAPVVAVPEVMPWHIPLATAEWVDSTRRALETAALASAPSTPGRYVVIDGSLPVTDRHDVFSVVKNPEAELLLDPDQLPTEAGWRSPALLLPAERHGRETDRITAFVRLRDTGGHRPWNFSLIRVEIRGDAEDPLRLLDRAIATAMTQVQPLGADPRLGHLRGFADCEAALHARTPVVITHLA